MSKQPTPEQPSPLLRPLMEVSQSRPVEPTTSDTTNAAAWHWVLVIALLAVGLRLGLYTLGPGQDIRQAYYPDSPRYLQLADNLVEYGSFGLVMEQPGTIYAPLTALRAKRGELEPRDAHGLRPELMRTPGYPFFIAALKGLGASTHAVLVIQCLFSAVSVILVYALGVQLLGKPGPAMLAALLVAFNPADVIAPNSILSETLFTTVMLMGIAIAVLAGQQGLLAAMFAGLTLGVATLIRPIAILLGPAVALWSFVTYPKFRTLVTAAMLALCSLVPTGLWAMRNHTVGYAFDISYVDSLQHFSKTAAFMQLRERGEPWVYPGDWLATYHQLLAELSNRIQPDETVIEAMDRIAFEKIKAQPGLYVAVLGDSALKFMTDHSLGALYALLGWQYHPTGVRDQLLHGDFSSLRIENLRTIAAPLLWSGFNVVLAVLTLGGLVALGWQRRWATLVLLAGLMVYFVLATQAHGLERMRLPVLGIQAITVTAVFIRRTPRSKVISPAAVVH